MANEDNYTEAKTKTVTTTLDRLPFGTYTKENINYKEKVKLPDGVTHRELMRDAIVIAWPSLIELILTSLTGMVDQVMVGNMEGTKGVIGLAAVSLSNQPKLLLMTLMIAMNVGTTAIVARYRGQQKRDTANQVFKQSLMLNILMGFAMMLLGLALADQLVEIMTGKAISAETKNLAADYLRVQLYGFLPLCMTFSVTSALRGIGDSKTPLLYNTVANLVNLFFNWVMIYGRLGCPELGVVGASIATVIGQTVAFFIAMAVMLRGRRYILLRFREKFCFDRSLFAEVTRVGLPSMVEQLLMRIGIIVFIRVVSGFGEMIYAAHTICMSVMSLSFMLGQAFANSSTTLMGQSLGKARFDMAKLYMKETRLLGLYFSIIMGALFAVFSTEIMTIYNKTPEVIEAGTPILVLLGAMQPIQCDQFIVSGGLRGAGDTKFSAVCSAVTVLGVRMLVVLLLVVVFNFGLIGAWLAILADTVVRMLLCSWRYESGKWAKRALY